MAWRAYYADGSRYESTDVDWRDLPAEGLVGVVVFHDPPYRQIVDGGDWFYLDDDGTPATTATADQWGEWVDPPDAPETEVKRGQALSDVAWERVRHEMIDDRTWP